MLPCLALFHTFSGVRKTVNVSTELRRAGTGTAKQEMLAKQFAIETLRGTRRRK